MKTRIDLDSRSTETMILTFNVVVARWSQIHPFFPGRSSYALQNRWRKLQQYRQMNELFRSLQVPFVRSFVRSGSSDFTPSLDLLVRRSIVHPQVLSNEDDRPLVININIIRSLSSTRLSIDAGSIAMFIRQSFVHSILPRNRFKRRDEFHGHSSVSQETFNVDRCATNERRTSVTKTYTKEANEIVSISSHTSVPWLSSI